jgi:uncharacterized protein
MTASNPPPGADPSMEDILASIRRILSEDETEAQAAPPTAAPHAGEPLAMPSTDVLALDASMLVDEPPSVPGLNAAHQAAPQPSPMPAMPAPRFETTEPTVSAAPPQPPAQPPAAAQLSPAGEERHEPPQGSTTGSLLGAEASAAATSSMGSLLRTLATERQQVPVYRGGPTLDDLVREEIRPVLKLWLDTHLSPMVERLVRAEIERLVGRALS